MYKQGQEIEGAGEIIGVYPDKITLRYAENEYSVELAALSAGSDRATASSRSRTPRSRTGKAKAGRDFSQFARRTNENEYVVSKRAIDESLQSPKNILTDARLVPNLIKGKQNGFKVMEIKKGGLYETLGLTNGDGRTKIQSHHIHDQEQGNEENDIVNVTSRLVDVGLPNILRRRGHNVDHQWS